jgi:hypothetical protein
VSLAWWCPMLRCPMRNCPTSNRFECWAWNRFAAAGHCFDCCPSVPWPALRPTEQAQPCREASSSQDLLV